MLVCSSFFFFFKQKTAYEMRISDWSSDVCSSDLSKHEPKGKTGFAHLFEHLMFNGSENAPNDFFEPLRQVGATDFNGTTFLDRTNYFETVPTGALDLALFLESDRMGHLLGAVTQDKLDNQSGDCRKAKGQADNIPYGMLRHEIFENLFPK